MTTNPEFGFTKIVVFKLAVKCMTKNHSANATKNQMTTPVLLLLLSNAKTIGEVIAQDAGKRAKTPRSAKLFAVFAPNRFDLNVNSNEPSALTVLS